MKIDNDIPKYRKKKKSSTSKSLEKSNHKHEYTEKCIIKYPTLHLKRINGKEFCLCATTYCKYCGKIGDSLPRHKEEYVGEPLNRTIKRLMTDEEIFECYKDVDVIEVEDAFAKYIPINVG